MKTKFLITLWIGLLAGGSAMAQTTGNISTEDRTAGNITQMNAANIIHSDPGDDRHPNDPKYGVDPIGINFGVDDPIYIPPDEDEKDSVKTDVIVIKKEIREKHSYVAIFHARAEAATATLTEQNLDRKIRNLKSQLSRMRIPGSDVASRFISLIPLYKVDVVESPYRPDDEETEPSSFEMKKSVRVTFYDYDQLTSIVRVAERAGIKDLEKVEHLIERY